METAEQLRARAAQASTRAEQRRLLFLALLVERTGSST